MSLDSDVVFSPKTSIQNILHKKYQDYYYMHGNDYTPLQHHCIMILIVFTYIRSINNNLVARLHYTCVITNKHPNIGPLNRKQLFRADTI